MRNSWERGRLLGWNLGLLGFFRGKERKNEKNRKKIGKIGKNKTISMSPKFLV